MPLCKVFMKQKTKNYQKLTNDQIKEINIDPLQSMLMPKQERGIKNSNALKYELDIQEELDLRKKTFSLTMEAKNSFFGKDSLGAAFNVYAPGEFKQKLKNGEQSFVPVKTWSFATESGDSVSYDWQLSDFKNGVYHLRLYGPNGFYREYKGPQRNLLDVQVQYTFTGIQKTATLSFSLQNIDLNNDIECSLKNTVYGSNVITEKIKANSTKRIVFDLSNLYNWYDIEIRIKGQDDYLRRFAGRIENGKDGKTDPYMGGVL